MVVDSRRDDGRGLQSGISISVCSSECVLPVAVVVVVVVVVVGDDGGSMDSVFFPDEFILCIGGVMCVVCMQVRVSVRV